MYHHTNGSPVADSRILSLLPRQGLMTSYHIQLLQLGALPWNWILSHHQRPFTSEPALVGFVRLDRKKFLQQEWHWHRLLRDAVDAPSLETFQARLDRAVTVWSGWRYPSSLQEGWTRGPLKVSCNPNHSLILRRHKIPFQANPVTMALVPPTKVHDLTWITPVCHPLEHQTSNKGTCRTTLGVLKHCRRGDTASAIFCSQLHPYS